MIVHYGNDSTKCEMHRATIVHFAPELFGPSDRHQHF